MRHYERNVYTLQTCPPGFCVPGAGGKLHSRVFAITKNLQLIALCEFQKVYVENHPSI